MKIYYAWALQLTCSVSYLSEGKHLDFLSVSFVAVTFLLVWYSVAD